MIAILQTLALVSFPTIVIVAALRDATSYTINNWISLAGLAAFAPAALLCGLAPGAFGISALVFVAALVAGIVMFSLGWIGGGDAKLFAVCGLWLGWPAFATFTIVTALAGGALAVGLLWGRRLAPAGIASGPAWVSRLMTVGGDVPYGVAIAVGALSAFPDSPLVQAASLLR